MRILALDLSLSTTGWAVSVDAVLAPDATSGVWSPPKDVARGPARLAWFRSQLRGMAAADLVVIEGYAFAATMSGARDVAELGGVIRLALFDWGVRYVEVPPASLKKFATGKGNADKPTVLAAAIRKLEYGGSSFDEADALWMAEMARVRYDHAAYQTLTVAQHEALKGVPWPTMPVALA